MPPVPARPLSTWQIIRSRGTNSLALCDEALFDELFVERRFLWRKFFVISDPDGIRRVLIDNADGYRMQRFKRRQLGPGMPTGILHTNGEIWRRHRALLGPALDYRATAPDVPMTIRWTEELAQHLAALPPGREIDLGHAVSTLIEVATAEFFAADAPEIRPMLFRMAKFPGRRRVGDYLPIPDPLRLRTYQLRAEVRQWYPLIDRLIAARRDPAYAGAKDLMWRIAHARTRDGDALGPQEIRDEVLTLAIGSIETTLRPICWLFYLLAMHPWPERRLHDELDRVLAGRTVALDDLPKLDFMRRAVDEAMRLYAPVPIMMREAVADDVVCGHRIPRGSQVIVAPWVIHRHRRLWRDPGRFDPDRFTPQNSAGRSRYSFLPFGVGPRTCVAAPLAILQIHIAAAVLAQRFRFRLVPGHPIEPTGWNTLRPARGIRVTVEPR